MVEEEVCVEFGLREWQKAKIPLDESRLPELEFVTPFPHRRSPPLPWLSPTAQLDLRIVPSMEVEHTGQRFAVQCSSSQRGWRPADTVLERELDGRLVTPLGHSVVSPHVASGRALGIFPLHPQGRGSLLIVFR